MRLDSNIVWGVLRLTDKGSASQIDLLNNVNHIQSKKKVKVLYEKFQSWRGGGRGRGQWGLGSWSAQEKFGRFDLEFQHLSTSFSRPETSGEHAILTLVLKWSFLLLLWVATCLLGVMCSFLPIQAGLIIIW